MSIRQSGIFILIILCYQKCRFISIIMNVYYATTNIFGIGCFVAIEYKINKRQNQRLWKLRFSGLICFLKIFEIIEFSL